MKKLLFLAAVLAAGVASAELQWETSVNVPADFVPLSDNLMLGTTKNALTDGQLPDALKENTYQCWVTSGQVFTCTSEMPKDVKQIRIFSEWDHAYDGFAVDAISVRYAGSDEYVVLDGSA